MSSSLTVLKTGDQLLALIQEKYPAYHPILHAADIAHDAEVSVSIHMDAIKTMLKYTTPDVKSIDINSRIGGNVDKLELLAFGLNDLEDVVGDAEFEVVPAI